MITVYVVTHNEEDNHYILAAFSTEKKAKRYENEIRDDFSDIEEVNIDDPENE